MSRRNRPNLQLLARDDGDLEILRGGEYGGYICLNEHQQPVPRDLLVGGVRIGAGGHGEVSRIIYNGVVIARKDVKVELHLNSRDSDFAKKSVEKKLREVDVIKGCANCYCIVHFYGYFVEKDRNCVNIHIFMEELRLSAAVLEREVENRGQKIPEFVIGRITCSVLHALQFLKEKMQMIHRDVKPSNILIDDDGRVKICDFGISGKLQNSRAYTNNGCQQYTAPELIANSLDLRGYSVKSDIWSLGITIWELSTLRLPYPKTTGIALAGAIDREPAPIMERGEYSDRLVEFVGKLLQKDKDARPTFSEIKELPFFKEHDVPFTCIGTGVGAPFESSNANRPSVGAWLDNFLYSETL
ncbi:unnamed protein product [Caenorhabditis sp. 36 PRJEB53466]|nr:unnamed protein product [Caenorhabditis sp. 36 PRJEB53466]